jgi:hypothetical protein
MMRNNPSQCQKKIKTNEMFINFVDELCILKNKILSKKKLNWDNADSLKILKSIIPTYELLKKNRNVTLDVLKQNNQDNQSMQVDDIKKYKHYAPTQNQNMVNKEIKFAKIVHQLIDKNIKELSQITDTDWFFIETYNDKNDTSSLNNTGDNIYIDDSDDEYNDVKCNRVMNSICSDDEYNDVKCNRVMNSICSDEEYNDVKYNRVMNSICSDDEYNDVKCNRVMNSICSSDNDNNDFDNDNDGDGDNNMNMWIMDTLDDIYKIPNSESIPRIS